MKSMTLMLLVAVSAFSYSFKTALVFRNETGQPVSLHITGGDYFNALYAGESVQNARYNSDTTIYFAPYETKSVELILDCIDDDRPPPSVGHRVVPSGLRRDDGITSPDQVRSRLREIMDGQSQTHDMMQ